MTSNTPFHLTPGLAPCGRSVRRSERVAFTTAQRAVEKLEAAGVLKQVNRARRDRVYCATALLRILEEPARLVPMEAA